MLVAVRRHWHRSWRSFSSWHGARSVAAARLNQLRGCAANGGLPDVDDGRLADTPTNVDRVRIVAAAERAVADRLHVESDGDRKPQPGRPMTLVKSGPPLETVPGALSEPSTLKVGSKGRLRKIRGSSN